MNHAGNFDLVAGIVLATREDPEISSNELGRRLGCSPHTATKWRKALEGDERAELLSELRAAGYRV
jgi:Mn-dependent DtxR family transcriptional regulator